MSLLDDLQSILAPDQQIHGRVVSIGNTVRVATSRGVVEVSREDGVAVGDLVMIRDRRAIRMHRGLERIFHV